MVLMVFSHLFDPPKLLKTGVFAPFPLVPLVPLLPLLPLLPLIHTSYLCKVKGFLSLNSTLRT